MANSSNQPSHPLRSEPTSKPAGLHLNNWLRLSHDRGPPNSKGWLLSCQRQPGTVEGPQRMESCRSSNVARTARSRNSRPLTGIAIVTKKGCRPTFHGELVHHRILGLCTGFYVAGHSMENS